MAGVFFAARDNNEYYLFYTIIIGRVLLCTAAFLMVIPVASIRAVEPPTKYSFSVVRQTALMSGSYATELQRHKALFFDKVLLVGQIM